MSHLVQFDILLGLPPTEQPDDLVETEKSQGTTWVKSWITNVFSNSGTSESPPPGMYRQSDKTRCIGVQYFSVKFPTAALTLTGMSQATLTPIY